MGGWISLSSPTTITPISGSPRHGKTARFSRQEMRLINRYLPSFVYRDKSTEEHRHIAAVHWDRVFKETTERRSIVSAEEPPPGQTHRVAKHLHTVLNNKITQLYDVFFAYLEDHSPELKPIFRSSMHVRGRVLVHISVGMRTMLASENMVDKVLHLTSTHLRFGVKMEHYESVGKALLHAMMVVSGENWSAEIEDAWKRLFSHTSTILIMAQRVAEKQTKESIRKKSKGSFSIASKSFISSPTLKDLFPNMRGSRKGQCSTTS